MSNPSSPTWVPGAHGSAHDVDNLPYAATGAGLVARIGDQALDLAAAARATRPDLLPLVSASVLNPLLAAGPATWAGVRAWIVDLLTDATWAGRLSLVAVDRLALRLPVAVGDYVDFYASEHHARTVGQILRPGAEPLHPSWRHLPVGYHGRAGSLVVSGTDVRRPAGQRLDDGASAPSFGPTRRLDLEAELGFVVGQGVPLGTPVPVTAFEQVVFGVAGLNDWSARDLQAWEYVPLGPHLGKSFATSLSAWVTPLAALEPARVDLPGQDPPVLPYLALPEGWPGGYDICVEVEVAGTVVATAPYATTYWSPAQMLAHLTVNGASLRVGDLFASGTISGPERDQRGSLMELSWGGQEPVATAAGERTFLEDGDEVVLRCSAPAAPGRPNARIGLGEVRGRVRPA